MRDVAVSINFNYFGMEYKHNSNLFLILFLQCEMVDFIQCHNGGIYNVLRKWQHEHQIKIEPQHEISNNVVCAIITGSDQPTHTPSLVRAFASRLNIFMTVKLLTEYHLEFLHLRGDCTSSSVSTLVKMPHRWKSHVSQMMFPNDFLWDGKRAQYDAYNRLDKWICCH